LSALMVVLATAALVVLAYFVVLLALAVGLVPVVITEFWQGFKVKAEVSVGDLATAMVAMVSVLALWCAWFQLRGIGTQTRANVLLELDQRWESREMLAVRRELNDFLDRARGMVHAGSPTLPEIVAAELERMRTTPADRTTYLKLLRICGFFETVGYATRAGYIRATDVSNLLGGSIRDTGATFVTHITHVQRVYNTPRLYEHYVWLTDVVRRETERTSGGPF